MQADGELLTCSLPFVEALARWRAEATAPPDSEMMETFGDLARKTVAAGATGNESQVQVMLGDAAGWAATAIERQQPLYVWFEPEVPLYLSSAAHKKLVEKYTGPRP